METEELAANTHRERRFGPGWIFLIPPCRLHRLRANAASLKSMEQLAIDCLPQRSAI